MVVRRRAPGARARRTARSPGRRSGRRPGPSMPGWPAFGPGALAAAGASSPRCAPSDSSAVMTSIAVVPERRRVRGSAAPTSCSQRFDRAQAARAAVGAGRVVPVVAEVGRDVAQGAAWCDVVLRGRRVSAGSGRTCVLQYDGRAGDRPEVHERVVPRGVLLPLASPLRPGLGAPSAGCWQGRAHVLHVAASSVSPRPVSWPGRVRDLLRVDAAVADDLARRGIGAGSRGTASSVGQSGWIGVVRALPGDLGEVVAAGCGARCRSSCVSSTPLARSVLARYGAARVGAPGRVGSPCSRC